MNHTVNCGCKHLLRQIEKTLSDNERHQMMLIVREVSEEKFAAWKDKSLSYKSIAIVAAFKGYLYRIWLERN